MPSSGLRGYLCSAHAGKYKYLFKKKKNLKSVLRNLVGSGVKLKQQIFQIASIIGDLYPKFSSHLLFLKKLEGFVNVRLKIFCLACKRLCSVSQWCKQLSCPKQGAVCTRTWWYTCRSLKLKGISVFLLQSRPLAFAYLGFCILVSAAAKTDTSLSTIGHTSPGSSVSQTNPHAHIYKESKGSASLETLNARRSW